MGSFLGVCLIFLFLFFKKTMTPSTTCPLWRGKKKKSQISRTLSFACLITVSGVSVSRSLDLVSLCNWVFCLCLVFESDTADACRWVTEETEGVERWSGCRWGRGEDFQSPPHCPVFLSFRDTPISTDLPQCSSSSFPRILNKPQPDSSSMAFCLSVGSRPCFQVYPG